MVTKYYLDCEPGPVFVRIPREILILSALLFTVGCSYDTNLGKISNDGGNVSLTHFMDSDLGDPPQNDLDMSAIDSGEPGWASQKDAKVTETIDTEPLPSSLNVCIDDPEFAPSASRIPYQNHHADDLGEFGMVINMEGKQYEQDIYDHKSPGEHQRIEADREHLYFKIPAHKSGSNGNDDATGCTWHNKITPSTHTVMTYNVKFTGAGFNDGGDIQKVPCTKTSNECFMGGKLPGFGLGDDPHSGCEHGPDGGSFRVMFMDMDQEGPNPPEFISYTYTQGTPIKGDPEEGSDRGSTPDPNDRCGTQKSLSPRVFIKPNMWYKLEVDINITDENEGTGTYSLKAYGCNASGDSCTKLLGSLSRNADFLDQGVLKVTQLMMHVYAGGNITDVHWRLPQDGEIVIKDLTVAISSACQ